MIAEIGHFALILALVVALVQSVPVLVGAQKNNASMMQLAAPASLVQLGLLMLSFGALMTAFVVSDFSLVAVAKYSHTAKPLLYKISGVWGNHEGSILLWVLILASYGAAVTVFGRRLPLRFRSRVLGVQALIGVGLLSFSVFTSNPFERLVPAPLDGQGLNPLLQDPGLAFHPPMLYLGYVGFSIAFSFAIAGLLEGRIDALWARWVRPWTLAAWCFLTAGIALGSWWAYYELGWGGWWFWDPVENASLLPWLAGTALLHSSVVVERRETLKSWTILLAIIAFSLSLLGTFIVRSGVLNSVHAFASDPTRGVYILAFLTLVVGGSLVLFAVRASSMQPGGAFAPVSRESGLLINNLFLATATGTILFGTLYPMFADAFGYKVTVAAPYFNAVFIPLMVPMLVLMAVGPLTPWKRGNLSQILKRLLPALVAVVVVLGAVLGGVDRVSPMALLGLALGTWLAMGVLIMLAGRIDLFRQPWAGVLHRVWRLPRGVWGMASAHMGVAVLTVGITASIAWERETITLMQTGDTEMLGRYAITLTEVKAVKGPNYDAIEGTFEIASAGEKVTTLRPQIRRFLHPPIQTTEAAIYSLLSGDLYAVIGEARGDGIWAVRLYHKPLLAWLWIGAFLMVSGGLLSLSDRRLRIGKKAPAL